jgi:hypothetical protein
MTASNGAEQNAETQHRDMKQININRRAAKKQAKKLGFDPDKMLFCPECGRTVIQKQKAGNPGYKDKIFCTCEDVGLPMIPVVSDDE